MNHGGGQNATVDEAAERVARNDEDAFRLALAASGGGGGVSEVDEAPSTSAILLEGGSAAFAAQSFVTQQIDDAAVQSQLTIQSDGSAAEELLADLRKLPDEWLAHHDQTIPRPPPPDVDSRPPLPEGWMEYDGEESEGKEAPVVAGEKHESQLGKQGSQRDDDRSVVQPSAVYHDDGSFSTSREDVHSTILLHAEGSDRDGNEWLEGSVGSDDRRYEGSSSTENEFFHSDNGVHKVGKPEKGVIEGTMNHQAVQSSATQSGTPVRVDAGGNDRNFHEEHCDTSGPAPIPHPKAHHHESACAYLHNDDRHIKEHAQSPQPEQKRPSHPSTPPHEKERQPPSPQLQDHRHTTSSGFGGQASNNDDVALAWEVADLLMLSGDSEELNSGRSNANDGKSLRGFLGGALSHIKSRLEVVFPPCAACAAAAVLASDDTSVSWALRLVFRCAYTLTAAALIEVLLFSAFVDRIFVVKWAPWTYLVLDSFRGPPATLLITCFLPSAWAKILSENFDGRFWQQAHTDSRYDALLIMLVIAAVVLGVAELTLRRLLEKNTLSHFSNRVKTIARKRRVLKILVSRAMDEANKLVEEQRHHFHQQSTLADSSMYFKRWGSRAFLGSRGGLQVQGTGVQSNRRYHLARRRHRTSFQTPVTTRGDSHASKTTPAEPSGGESKHAHHVWGSAEDEGKSSDQQRAGESASPSTTLPRPLQQFPVDTNESKVLGLGLPTSKRLLTFRRQLESLKTFNVGARGLGDAVTVQQAHRRAKRVFRLLCRASRSETPPGEAMPGTEGERPGGRESNDTEQSISRNVMLKWIERATRTSSIGRTAMLQIACKEMFLSRQPLDGQDVVSEDDFIKTFCHVYEEHRFISASVDSIAPINRMTRGLVKTILAAMITLIGLLVTEALPWQVVFGLASIAGSILVALNAPISQYLNGLVYVLLVRPYDIGDRVILGAVTGERGSGKGMSMPLTVRSINVLSTIFTTSEAETITMRNQDMLSLSIRNHTRSPNAALLCRIDLAWSTPPQKLAAFVEAVHGFAKAHPQELTDTFTFIDRGDGAGGDFMTLRFYTWLYTAPVITWDKWSVTSNVKQRFILFVHSYCYHAGIDCSVPLSIKDSAPNFGGKSYATNA